MNKTGPFICSVVLTPYDHPWQPGAEIIEAWRVLNKNSVTNGAVRVIMDVHVEEPDADPLVVLWYPMGVALVFDKCLLALWRDDLWLLGNKIITIGAGGQNS